MQLAIHNSIFYLSMLLSLIVLENSQMKDIFVCNLPRRSTSRATAVLLNREVEAKLAELGVEWRIQWIQVQANNEPACAFLAMDNRLDHRRSVALLIASVIAQMGRANLRVLDAIPKQSYLRRHLEWHYKYFKLGDHTYLLSACDET